MPTSTSYVIQDEPYQAVIRINDKTGQWEPNPDELAQELREKANCPIIIDWTAIRPCDQESFPNPGPHAALLIQQMHRWKEISIYVGYMPIDYFSSIKGTAPWLETVLIEAPHWTYDLPQYSEVISSIWATAPRFRSYTLTQCNEFASRSQKDMPTLQLPYANLITLRIDAVVLHVEDCVRILANTKRLLHCRLGSVAAPKAPLPTSRLVHDTLQSLFIASNWADHHAETETFAHRLLDYVRTPALRRLVVENDSHWDSALFERFLADSECDLEALEFHMVKVSGHNLFSTIRTYCPNIRVFKIYADYSQRPPPISRSAWERLRYNEGDAEVFLPKLTLFFVNEEALMDANHPDGELAAVVYSRLNKGLQVVWFQVEEQEKSLNAAALRTLFPPGNIQSHWDLKHLVIDEDAQPEYWNDCVQEYLWPTGSGWRPPAHLDEADADDRDGMDSDGDSDEDEDSEVDGSDMDCD